MVSLLARFFRASETDSGDSPATDICRRGVTDVPDDHTTLTRQRRQSIFATRTPYFSQLKAAKPYKLEAFPEGDKAWSDAVAAAYNGRDAQTVLNDAQAKAAAAIGG